MMHTTETRAKGLYKNHMVKLEPVVSSGAMEISANQGHIYNTNWEVEGPSAKR